jgi:para-nitrobenzyl esterase
VAWRKASIGAVISVLMLWLIPAAPSLASGPVVHTAQGDVAGVANGSVNEWLGIPYAAPPVGDLRWRAGAAPAPWSGTRDATSFGSDCIQLLANSNKKTEGSEDCLYLNVFVPSGTRASSKLPVMVHLHPGGNGFGAGYQTSGTFTDHGVIIVTLNYRLGAFGFIGHPLLSAENNGSSGEYGLLDQIAALKWVQTNIAAFGGNPSNVTLFGSSAGADDAAALVASPLAAGLFQKAAIQGTWWQTVSGADTQMSDAETLGKKSFKATGCTTAACLRAVPAKELVQDAGSNLNIHPWTGG